MSGSMRVSFFAREEAISRTFKIIRASPLLDSIKNLLALGLILTCLLAGRLLRCLSPRVIILLKSSSVSRFITRTRQRERRAEIISKLGFSVVAPIKIISPRST